MPLSSLMDRAMICLAYECDKSLALIDNNSTHNKFNIAFKK